MEPLAPARLRTTTDCPITFCSAGARLRADRSASPPMVKGTMMDTVLSG
jgi:hypothetical protein